MIQIEDIGRRFDIPGDFEDGGEINTGHINSTFQVSYRQPEGSLRRYILQAINRNVFKNPYAVMANVERVTRHINAKKTDPGGQTLDLIPSKCGTTWFEDDDGALWRCYNFIEGCVTYDIVENTRQAYQAAHAFGAFQNLISDLDATLIAETIPNFHHTRKRYDRLMEVSSIDPLGRLANVRQEYDLIRDRERYVDVLLDLAVSGKIPLRITHNDTKINNVMIDGKTDEAVCVIDLDTVMPGLALYDFGDLVRTATNPAAEDETDLTKVKMRLPMFKALVDGYLDAAGNFLNQTEIQHLVFSGKLITLELAIRFLTDYLEGDIYFKTERPGQNLDRCRVQLQLVREIEANEVEMKAYVMERGLWSA